MKLRIKGDSVRIRLTRSEVAALAREGAVEQRTSFGDDARFVTRVALGDVTHLTPRLRDHVLEIIVPDQEGRQWETGDAIALESQGRPHVLLEKDFACLHPRDGEPAGHGDDDDTFPRPGRLT